MLVNISNSVVLYITSSYLTEHIEDNECDYYYSSYKDIQYNSIKLNIKIDRLIIHNFADCLNQTIFWIFYIQNHVKYYIQNHVKYYVMPMVLEIIIKKKCFIC